MYGEIDGIYNRQTDRRARYFLPGAAVCLNVGIIFYFTALTSFTQAA